MGVAAERAAELVRRAVHSPSGEREEAREEIMRELDFSLEDLRETLAMPGGEAYLSERLTLSERSTLARDKEQLLDLLGKLIRAEGTQAQTDEWLRIVAANVPAPYSVLTGLIYYPDAEATAEGVLAEALAYRSRTFHL